MTVFMAARKSAEESAESIKESRGHIDPHTAQTHEADQ
jgi:hypothetical protein